MNVVIAHLFYFVSLASAGYTNPSGSKRLLYNVLGLDRTYGNQIGRNDYQDILSSSKTSLRNGIKPVDRTSNEAEDRFARYLGDNNIICEVIITEGIFAEEGFEFYPSTYVNKTCAYSSADPFKIESNGSRKPEVCLHNDNDFGCQTLYDELKVLKKNIKGKYECWERMTQLVAVGCKCNIRFEYH